MRVSNVYFLITAVLSFIPGFSPLPGYTSVIPLAFVLLMSMSRDAYEDIVKHTSSKLIIETKEK
jgi:phospholipid-transporting ATPase